MRRTFIIDHAAVSQDVSQVLTAYYSCVGATTAWSASNSPFLGEWWDPSPRFPAVLSLFNRVGSGVLVRVTKVEVDTLASGYQGNSSYVHAVLRGITACAGGTALTAVKMDSGAADPPAGLEVLLYPTATPLDAANTIRQTNVIPSPRSFESVSSIAVMLGRAGGFAGRGLACGEMLGARSPAQALVLRPGEGAAWYPIAAEGSPQRYWVELALSSGGATYCYQTEFDVEAGEQLERLPLVVWNDSASVVQVDRCCLVAMGEDLPVYEVVPVDDVVGGATVVPVGMDSQLGVPPGVEVRHLPVVVRGGSRVGGKMPYVTAPVDGQMNTGGVSIVQAVLNGRYGLITVANIGYSNVSSSRWVGLLGGPAIRVVDLPSAAAILLREGQGLALVPRKRAVWGGNVRGRITFTTEYPARPVARAHVGM